MGLNKQKGNMYGFVTHTWNPIKGRCIHNCSYCYMHNKWKNMPNDTLRLDEKEFKEFDRDMKKYGDSGHFIFVGSSTDIWAKNVPTPWLVKIMLHIKKYPNNTYLFQTKYPAGLSFYNAKNIVLGITLETNRIDMPVSKAIVPPLRARAFAIIPHYRKMVTIEPIMEFDLKPFVFMIKSIKPEWVNIGADSQGNKLPEPSREKILLLGAELKKFTEVKYKKNIKRLLNRPQNK